MSLHITYNLAFIHKSEDLFELKKILRAFIILLLLLYYYSGGKMFASKQYLQGSWIVYVVTFSYKST